MAKIFNDFELVEEYKKNNRCKEVAAKFGCSDETVRRALIKYDVPRIVRHSRPVTRPKATEEELRSIVAEYFNSDATINDLSQKYHRSQYTISTAIKRIGGKLKNCGKNQKKISDDDLIKCVNQGMSCSQIALKYSMSAEQVFRRGRKLGLQIHDKYRGGNWLRRSQLYGCTEYDETITLDKVYEKFNGICQICGLMTDKSDVENGHIKRMYPTVDHIVPLSKGGTHTWGNVQLAHMMCNAGKCDKLTSR